MADGKRSSVYLTADDLKRIEDAGSPSLATLIREALDHRSGSGPGDPVQPAAQDVLARAGRSGSGCGHPKQRRDGKNPHLCRACGGYVP